MPTTGLKLTAFAAVAGLAFAAPAAAEDLRTISFGLPSKSLR